MPRYVVLLRGVNVGGRQLISMAKLRSMLEGLGYDAVRTYLQSGNAVVTSPKRSAAAITNEIEQAISADFGATVKVMVRTDTELAAAIAANPTGREPADPTKLHIAFLDAKPSAAAARALTVPAGDPGQFWLVGRELYLSLPDGAGRTKLTGTYLERKLGVAMTVRNWRTVTALGALASE